MRGWEDAVGREGATLDRRTAAAGAGKGSDRIQLICGTASFANVHDELVAALVDLDADLVAPDADPQ